MSTKHDNHIRIGCKTPQALGNTQATKQRLTAKRHQQATEQRFRSEFAGSEAFMRKYQQVAALMSNQLRGRVTIEGVFETLLDEYIERHDHEERSLRREQRARKKAGTNKNTNKNEASQRETQRRQANPAKKTKIFSRNIPVAVRDQVYIRDHKRCTYTSPGGRRCGATHNLHIDHIVPYSTGGGHDPSNLRLLCAAHNQLMAKRKLGEAHIAQFIRRDLRGKI